MSQTEKISLLLSIIISLAIWSFLFGAYIGFSLVYLLLVHEYGHYFWMGKEGITQRSMIMVPPLGAVAMAKEPWPSRLSEAKIAFAGPFFGLLSLLPLLWLLNTDPNNPQLRIIIYLGCYINLFNLLMPVAIMDGGRIIKSISFSINYQLGLFTLYLSFAGLLLIIYEFQSIMAIIISFLLLQGVLAEIKIAKQKDTMERIPKMSVLQILGLSSAYAFLVYCFLFIINENGITYRVFSEWLASQ